MYLNKRLFHTAHLVAIPLNDGSLKGDLLEFWHLERNGSGSRSEVATVMAAAVALAMLVTLVPGSLGQLLRLGLQQFIEGFFYAAAYKFLELPLDYFTIFSDMACCLLSEWCVVTSFYQSLQAMSSFMRFSICASYYTLS